MIFRVLLLFVAFFVTPLRGDEPKADTSRGDKMIAEYFRAETAKLADRCLADIKVLDDWTSRRNEYRRQLAEMLGLDPMPERTDLKPVVTGRLENEYFSVENLYFQSSPGLYVTGNLYLPKGLDQSSRGIGPAPAVLYVCGHGEVKKDGVSLGNKTHYQHHGGWFARNGFVCLTIDTVQLGEIEGLHHGTYREGMWWWNSRGYTPAGVEAWNGIRALDYLQSRPEVDGERMGVTGRSGGGAYSWWIAALDERIKAAVPVAGITDLQNHVVDGCVEGHCDCMFMVNTYRWDFPQVAALVAPRALLIANTDKDPIFPLDGVERLHAKVRRIYQLHGADDKLGLQISEGPHKDTQELQVATMHWFNRFLKGEDAPVEQTGITYFEPEQLRVFRDGLPADEITSKIHETFVPAAAPPKMPENKEEWQTQREAWMTALKEKCFRGWPEEPGPLNVKEICSVERDGFVLHAIDFDSDETVRLRLYYLHRTPLESAVQANLSIGPAFSIANLRTFQENFPEEFEETEFPSSSADIELESRALAPAHVVALFMPRQGREIFAPTQRPGIQNRRRYMLLGQTLAGMQVWDVRRALQAIRSVAVLRDARLVMDAGDKAEVTLYASLFEPPVAQLDISSVVFLRNRNVPDFLNVFRYLDVPEAIAMAAERGQVRVMQLGIGELDFPLAVAKRFGWDRNRLQISPLPGQTKPDGSSSE